MIPPLVREALGTELQSLAVPSEEAKVCDLPATMIGLIHRELLDYGFELPDEYRFGDVLVLTFAGVGNVELTPATIH